MRSPAARILFATRFPLMLAAAGCGEQAEKAADAQASLAELHDAGNGGPRDPVQVHVWFDLVSSRFPATGKEKQAAASKRRDVVASRMTPGQVAEAQRMAREWKPKKDR
jgi:hypothetical protein